MAFRLTRLFLETEQKKWKNRFFIFRKTECPLRQLGHAGLILGLQIHTDKSYHRHRRDMLSMELFRLDKRGLSIHDQGSFATTEIAVCCAQPLGIQILMWNKIISTPLFFPSMTYLCNIDLHWEMPGWRVICLSHRVIGWKCAAYLQKDKALHGVVTHFKYLCCLYIFPVCASSTYCSIIWDIVSSQGAGHT